MSFLDFCWFCKAKAGVDFDLLCVIWWRTWFRRNQVLFFNTVLPVDGIIEWAVNFLADFRDARRVDRSVWNDPGRMVRWKPPDAGRVKINSDAALDDVRMVSGIGVVIRDWKGNVFASCCHRFEAVYRPQIAEVELGLVLALVESNALEVVNLISAKVAPASDVWIVIHDSLNLVSSWFVSFNFVPRIAN
ncbi:hypothetical protein LWI28_001992 [Acer negundo]|uniref:RNase H type-1 domain-containing protein n=1 Tax=Acer negundo TaxID=4023 RepID=A0AAD5JEN2_ACENE|nr:hypothetical protein LWI28_001992 [Acer negundo]